MEQTVVQVAMVVIVELDHIVMVVVAVQLQL
jgi:hypothetical protein